MKWRKVSAIAVESEDPAGYVINWTLSNATTGVYMGIRLGSPSTIVHVVRGIPDGDLEKKKAAYTEVRAALERHARENPPAAMPASNRSR